MTPRCSACMMKAFRCWSPPIAGRLRIMKSALANQLGMDVVVTDHHQTDEAHASGSGGDESPSGGAQYPFRGLCSAGLAYKVAQAYQTALRRRPACRWSRCWISWRWRRSPTWCRYRMRIASFVRAGARADFARSALRHPGVEASGRRRAGLHAETIAFKLAPRLNAAGRLDHAMMGVQLLTTDSPAEAQQLADRLEQLNRERQKIEADIVAEAVEAVNEQELPAALVLASRRWHLGRGRDRRRPHCGTVSSADDCHCHRRTRDRQRLGTDNRRVRSLSRACACRDLLDAFGGHPSAAGVTVQESRLDEFRERFAAVVAEWTRRSPQPFRRCMWMRRCSCPR